MEFPVFVGLPNQEKANPLQIHSPLPGVEHLDLSHQGVLVPFLIEDFLPNSAISGITRTVATEKRKYFRLFFTAPPTLSQGSSIDAPARKSFDPNSDCSIHGR
jgi:hypothetical protein